MKKIDIQTQSMETGRIFASKPVNFVAINVDGIKITIDAYDGMGASAKPRHDSRLEIIDKTEVFELNPEALMEVLRFYCDYAQGSGKVERYRNRSHYLVPDAFREGKN
jgi:hypothetical protein